MMRGVDAERIVPGNISQGLDYKWILTVNK